MEEPVEFFGNFYSQDLELGGKMIPPFWLFFIVNNFSKHGVSVKKKNNQRTKWTSHWAIYNDQTVEGTLKWWWFSKGIPSKMAETIRLRIYDTLPRYVNHRENGGGKPLGLNNQPLLYTLYITWGIIFPENLRTGWPIWKDWAVPIYYVASWDLCFVPPVWQWWCISSALSCHRLQGLRVVRWQEVDEMIGGWCVPIESMGFRYIYLQTNP